MGAALCQNEGTHQTVVSFSPPVVGCLKGLQYRRGFTGTPGPPKYAPAVNVLAVLTSLEKLIFQASAIVEAK